MHQQFYTFIDGAEWADENPKKGLVSIDKVCEWLNSVDMRMYVIADHTSSNIYRFAMNKFISDLQGQIVETKIICNKCGSTNFGLHKSIFFCKDCGEMYKGDGKHYHIESLNILTGEIILSK